jgi:flagellin-like protein
MNFKKLFTEDRAVSPVIGVILMVAITVILAAVIGTFVLGLGDQVSESAPQAQFSFDFTDPGSGGEHVNVTHDGGDAVPSDQLAINIAGADAWSGADGDGSGFTSSDAWSDDVTAGDEMMVEADSDGGIVSGDQIRIIWTSSNSDKTATIGQAEFSA